MDGFGKFWSICHAPLENYVFQSPGRNGCLLLGKLWASTLQVRPANFEFSSIELALIKNINCRMTNRLSLPG